MSLFRNGKESEKSDKVLRKKLEIKRLPSNVLFVSFTESNYDETRKKLGKYKIILDLNLSFCVFAVFYNVNEYCEIGYVSMGFFQITHAKNSSLTRDLTRFFGICDLEKPILTRISSSQYSLIADNFDSRLD